eukprot:Rhum_TRINITY_DN1842_c0_g2::Rhum_TRINITY_DN1842_c0_g2_i1::g.4958::m.4958
MTLWVGKGRGSRMYKNGLLTKLVVVPLQPRVVECVGQRHPVGRRLLEQPGDEVLRRRVHGHVARELQLLLADLLEQLLLRGALLCGGKGRVPETHLEGEDADGPHVAARVVRQARAHLGGKVVEGAAHRHARRVVAQRNRPAKVAELQVAVAVEEGVLRLDVPVQHRRRLRVHVHQGFAQLRRVLGRHLLRETVVAVPAHLLVQRAAVAPLHDQVRARLVGEPRHQAHNVLVAERAVDGQLTLELLRAQLVEAHHLHRVDEVEALDAGRVDASELALADGRTHVEVLVRPDLAPGRLRGCLVHVLLVHLHRLRLPAVGGLHAGGAHLHVSHLVGNVLHGANVRVACGDVYCQ